MSIFNLLFGIAVLLTGLSAGLFYAYDCSVTGGLGKLPDRAYLQAFQSINRAIQNPYFFISFIGTLIALPVAAWQSYNSASNVAFYCLLAAAIVYAAGVFGVTVFGNVPLNERLDKFDIAGSSAEAIKAMREQFESKWNALHQVRTYAGILAFGLSVIAIVKR
jgi:uncharacterized membrane protein